ncbi:hypothetical protein HDU99_010895 [Rhizoclosmatium hyalinum]|nr:hypothetical protein HDU99_010895 [Rhizoclosmatium hyalinum]
MFGALEDEFAAGSGGPSVPLADYITFYIGVAQKDWAAEAMAESFTNAAAYKSIANGYAIFNVDLPLLQNLDESAKKVALRRAKAAIVLSLLYQPRKKLRAIADGANALVDTILASEPDEIVRAFAHLVKPFLKEVNPGVALDIDTVSPLFAKARNDIISLLEKHKDKINFVPHFYRYLDPFVTDHELQERISTSDFRIHNTWSIPSATNPNPPDIDNTLDIMNSSSESLFGPQLTFKAGHGLDAILKEREARRKHWDEYEAQKVTPVSATFPTANSTTPTSASFPNPPSSSAAGPSASSASSGLNPLKRPKPSPLPPPKRLGSLGGGAALNKPKGGAALHTAKKIMMLDDNFVATEEKAKFEEKRKHEEEVASAAARKAREAEERKLAAQRAKEEKERELLEKKLQRERAIEERRVRELEEKQRREEEKRQREEARRVREEEDRLREERRKMPPEPPQQIQMDPYPQSALPFIALQTASLPPPLPLPSPADTVLGADASTVSPEDRAAVEQFLAGHYDKSTPNREIKLNESTITDPTTGVSQIHTMYLVLDYEQCKWRKVKRKRRV